MNLNDREHAEFKISDLFDVKYGVNLELNACVECDKSDSQSVNFVSRTSENNGVSSHVKIIDGITPQKAGLISVAGGGSVLSTFLQNKPFYSGRDLYILKAKDNISDEAKMFVITIIEQNKYRYSYGRQANKTLPNLLLSLPINKNGNPDWEFMENYIKSLHYKPLTTRNKVDSALNLNIEKWKDFKVGDLFTIKRGDRIVHNQDYFDEQNDEYKYPVVTTTTMNNGVDGFYNNTNCDGNCIVSAGEASGMFSTYQENPFWALDTVRIYTPVGFNMNKYIGIFLATLLTYNMYRFSYGRKAKPDNMYSLDIKLPITQKGNPDWKFMENYIKSLPYGDRLKLNNLF